MTVSVSKTGGSDLVLSWIGVTGESTETPENPDTEEKADKTSLNHAITMAEAMEEQKSAYTAESWADVEKALKAAKELTADAAQAVYDKDNATQDEVGNALKALIAEILEVRLKGDTNLSGTVDSEDAAMELCQRREFSFHKYIQAISESHHYPQVSGTFRIDILFLKWEKEERNR